MVRDYAALVEVIAALPGCLALSKFTYSETSRVLHACLYLSRANCEVTFPFNTRTVAPYRIVRPVLAQGSRTPPVRGFPFRRLL